MSSGCVTSRFCVGLGLFALTYIVPWAHFAPVGSRCKWCLTPRCSITMDAAPGLPMAPNGVRLKMPAPRYTLSCWAYNVHLQVLVCVVDPVIPLGFVPHALIVARENSCIPAFSDGGNCEHSFWAYRSLDHVIPSPFVPYDPPGWLLHPKCSAARDKTCVGNIFPRRKTPGSLFHCNPRGLGTVTCVAHPLFREFACEASNDPGVCLYRSPFQCPATNSRDQSLSRIVRLYCGTGPFCPRFGQGTGSGPRLQFGGNPLRAQGKEPCAVEVPERAVLGKKHRPPPRCPAGCAPARGSAGRA